MKTLIVNFFGGPGSGKSTLCASVFAELKWLNVNCEMALEYAKDLVWEESDHVLKNQFYVFGNQIQRIFRLVDKVDVVLTDSPLLNSVIYDAHGNKNFEALIIGEHEKLRNLNIFVKRVKPYNPKGRVQTEEESKVLDQKIRDMLASYGFEYREIDGVRSKTHSVVELILSKIKKDVI